MEPTQLERFPHKPVITEMRNATVFRGEGAFFECHVISDLTPYILWYKHYDINGSYVNSTGAAYAKVIEVSGLLSFH